MTIKRRRDWDSTQRKIQRIYKNYQLQHGIDPSSAELAELANCSVRTVFRHMKYYNPQSTYDSFQKSYAQYAPNIMMAIYTKAIKGSPRSQRILLEIMFSYVPPISFDLIQQDQNHPDTPGWDELNRGLDLFAGYRLRRKEFKTKYPSIG